MSNFNIADMNLFYLKHLARTVCWEKLREKTSNKNIVFLPFFSVFPQITSILFIYSYLLSVLVIIYTICIFIFIYHEQIVFNRQLRYTFPLSNLFIFILLSSLSFFLFFFSFPFLGTVYWKNVHGLRRSVYQDQLLLLWANIIEALVNSIG